MFMDFFVLLNHRVGPYALNSLKKDKKNRHDFLKRIKIFFKCNFVSIGKLLIV